MFTNDQLYTEDGIPLSCFDNPDEDYQGIVYLKPSKPEIPWELRPLNSDVTMSYHYEDGLKVWEVA